MQYRPAPAAPRLGAFLALGLALSWAFASPATAQERETPPAKPSACQVAAVAEADSQPLQRVRYEGALAEGEIALTYLGHSSFLLQTPGGVSIATDYGDWLPADLGTDAVTMNGAHDGHFTFTPPPGVGQVFLGWDQRTGAPAFFDATIGDLRLRNVPTDDFQGPNNVIESGNSIFVFEIGDLCLVHLGHLHVVPSGEQYAAIGRADIVLAPVDGAYMIDAATMMRVADELGARIVVPMHHFSDEGRERFVSVFAARYEILRPTDPTMIVSVSDLPDQPHLIVLPGELR